MVLICSAILASSAARAVAASSFSFLTLAASAFFAASFSFFFLRSSAASLSASSFSNLSFAAFSMAAASAMAAVASDFFSRKTSNSAYKSSLCSIIPALICSPVSSSQEPQSSSS